MTILQYYSNAKATILDLGYGHEIDWQQNQNPVEVTESDFLREAAWVIYCSGFKEQTVRKYFNFLSMCFCDWSSAKAIADIGDRCIGAAMLGFRYRRKHEAVVAIASRIATIGFDEFRTNLLDAPISVIQELPFLGPITSIHLAKNLGFEVAKPDRHLVRLTSRFGYEDVDVMCREISDSCGDPIRVVDVVLWRYLERMSNGSSKLSSEPH